MKLTIHRGAHEIGGSCIELASDSTRIVLDVGMPLFGPDRKPFDQSALRGKSVEQLRSSHLLPDVPGLFTDGRPPDAILLSHAHMDHTGFLPFSRPEIPVYATTGTSKMMSAGAIFAGQADIPRVRYRRLVTGRPTQIGSIRVTAFSVDHSVYGSVAFLIESMGKTLLYSGDFRLHGRKTGMTKTLLAAIAGRPIDLLLMEGTLVGVDNNTDVGEYELEEAITKQISSSNDLVLASFSPQHVDRLVCFLRASQRTRRIFVVDVYAAYVMHLIRSEVTVPPPVQAQGLRVFYPEYFLAGHKRHHKLHDLFLADRISLEQILADRANHVMLFRPSMLNSDFRGRFPDNTLCLFSRWGGYLEQPDWKNTQEQLEATNGSLVLIHTSGHAFIDDLKQFAQAIDPRTIVPIHTFKPDEFQQHFKNVRVLRDGEPFDIA